MGTTTRTPLQPAPTLRACHAVGFDAYIVLYREGQEELARESIYRFARNPELAFSLNDAAVMGEQIPYAPEAATDCDCPACIQRSYDIGPFDYFAAVVRVGSVAAPWVLLVIAGRVVWGWVTR